MKTNFSMLFYLKKQKNYTTGLAPIYQRITVDGRRAVFDNNLHMGYFAREELHA